MTLNKRQMFLLILALGSTSMGQSLVFAILQPLGREVSLSELQITSIVSCSALLFSLMSPVWGRISDRRGRKAIIITGLLGYTLGTLLFGGAFYAGLSGILSGVALYLTLMITRCTQGAIMGGVGPAAGAYVADHSAPEKRLRAMATLGTAYALGTILGPAVSGVLAVFGLLAPLYFAAGITTFAALLILLLLPKSNNIQASKNKRRARLRMTDARLLPYLLTSIGTFVGYAGIVQTLGFQLQDSLQLNGIQTAQTAGFALMIAALGTFFSQTVLLQKMSWSALSFIRVGLIALLVGALSVAVFSQFWHLAIGMAFLGLGLGLITPSVSAAVSLAVHADEQGAAAGLVSACPGYGFVIGPLTAGFLYQYNPAFSALFCALVFIALLLMLARGFNAAQS